MTLFINEHRGAVEVIISNVRKYLLNLGKRTAVSAFDRGRQECLSKFSGTDCPLYTLVTDLPHDLEGDRRTPYTEPDIAEAFLAVSHLDQETRYQLYCWLASVYLKNNRSVTVKRLATKGGPASSLSPALFISLQHRVAVLMFSSGRYFTAQKMMEDWPTKLADDARAAAFMAHEHPTGLNAGTLLASITEPTRRSEAITSRINHEEREGRHAIALRLRRMRGQPENRPSYLQRIK